MDAEIRKRVKKFDTRAAEALSSLSNQTGSLVESMSRPNGFLETFFFGDQQNSSAQKKTAGKGKGKSDIGRRAGAKASKAEDSNVKTTSKKREGRGSSPDSPDMRDKRTTKEKNTNKNKKSVTASASILNAPQDSDLDPVSADVSRDSVGSSASRLSARRRSGSSGSAATVNVKPFEEGNSEILRYMPAHHCHHYRHLIFAVPLSSSQARHR